MQKQKRIIGLVTALLVTTILTACNKQTPVAKKPYLTPDDFEPYYYTDEASLPNDMFYIVRDEEVTLVDKKGNETTQTVTKYLPIYNMERNYTDPYETYAGFNSNRIMWANYNVDEGYIPTMYASDKLIYKSATYIPTAYSLEKFFDNGYTLGVCGFKQDTSSNYRYYSAAKNNGNGGYTMTTSDAVGFDGLEAESVYLIAMGEAKYEITTNRKGEEIKTPVPASEIEYERISPTNISLSGTVSGLELMKEYRCDIRTGTEKIDATLTCNVHYFSSAENYRFGTFEFITEHIAEIIIPEYVTTGYYNINGLGMFRYLTENIDYHTLEASDYNETIYTYDEEGRVDGTTIGMVFDEYGFLISSDLVGNLESSEGTGNTYQEYIEQQKHPITDRTLLRADANGYYNGKYEFLSVSEAIVSNTDNVYQIRAMNVNNTEVIQFQYTQSAGKEAPMDGVVYNVVFKESDNGFDGYEIATLIKGSGDIVSTEVESEILDTEIIETE